MTIWIISKYQSKELDGDGFCYSNTKAYKKSNSWKMFVHIHILNIDKCIDFFSLIKISSNEHT